MAERSVNSAAVSTVHRETAKGLVPLVGISNDSENPIPVATGLDSAMVGGKVLVGGARDKWRDCFTSLDSTTWDYITQKSASDYIGIAGNTQGASYLEIAINALFSNTKTTVCGIRSFSSPTRIGMGFNLSQRIYGDLVVIRSAAVDESGAPILAAGENSSGLGDPIPVASVVVSSNVALIKFAADHNLKHDDYFVVDGAADTRVNAFFRVTGIRNKRMVTAALTIASASYSVGASAVARRLDFSFGAANCFGFAFCEASSSAGIYFNRSAGAPILQSAQTTFGTSYTDAVIPSAQPYALNAQPRFMTEMVQSMDVLRWITPAVDSASAGTAIKRTQNVCDPTLKYAMFIDAVALPNRPRVLEIVSAVKTGTTTATVTTKDDHGLANGGYVRAYGQSNQTNWANVTSETAVTVTGARTLQLVWGAAVSETVYGGVLVVQNQTSVAVPVDTQRINGATWYNGRLYVGTSGAPALNNGDIVRLAGCYDTTGARRNDLDGRFRVIAYGSNINIQEDGVGNGTTTSGNGTIGLTNTAAVPFGSLLVGTGVGASAVVTGISGASVTVSVNSSATGSSLADIGITGMVLEPVDFVAPANMQPLVAMRGGAIVRETTLRMSFARAMDYTRTPVEVTGGHWQGDAQQAVPVAAPASLPVTATQSAAASISTTDGSGGWIIRPGIVGIADIASAAITSSATTASTVNDKGNAFQIVVPVTAVSGTSPTLDIGIEESFDGGTNWVRIYDLPRITAAGHYFTPPLFATGRNIRVVQTVGGTSPSFTRSMTRILLPFQFVKPQRQIFDRAVVLTTLGSSTQALLADPCNSVQLVVNIGSATTPPALKLQGSEDGASWYDIPNGTVTAAASSTVQVTVANVSAKFVRATVSTVGASVTAGYVLVKAWS